MVGDLLQESVEDCILLVATVLAHASHSELWAMDYREFWRNVVRANKKAKQDGDGSSSSKNSNRR